MEGGEGGMEGVREGVRWGDVCVRLLLARPVGRLRDTTTLPPTPPSPCPPSPLWGGHSRPLLPPLLGSGLGLGLGPGSAASCQML